jgi:SAM-dependent methyltransferase
MSSKKYFSMSETIKELLFSEVKPKDDCFYKANSCLVCNSRELNELFMQWGISYYKCNKCGFIFSNPRLTEKGCSLWYNSDWYNAAMMTEHYIARNYSKYYSISLAPLLLKNFFEIFESYDFKKEIKIADIGCGSGSVLHYLQDELNFKNLVGYDLNESNINFAINFRNININMVDIYTLGNKEKFDVIISTENIEHVSNPEQYLKLIKSIIKKDGYLFITTPHNDKIALKLMGIFSDHYCAPNHQNYFDFRTLSTLLDKYDFFVDKCYFFDKQKFNLKSYLKHFIIKRDQVTAYPPVRAKLDNIYKWQKNINNSVLLDKYTSNDFEFVDKDESKSISAFKKLKRFLKSPFPIHFITHQTIVAKNN